MVDRRRGQARLRPRCPFSALSPRRPITGMRIPVATSPPAGSTSCPGCSLQRTHKTYAARVPCARASRRAFLTPVHEVAGPRAATACRADRPPCWRDRDGNEHSVRGLPSPSGRQRSDAPRGHAEGRVSCLTGSAPAPLKSWIAMAIADPVYELFALRYATRDAAARPFSRRRSV